MEFPVWFETLTVQAQNVVKVWLRHPYRMILCDLAELIQQERESKSVHLANHFTLIPGTYTVYRSLPPVQDCKMPVLIEERESGTGQEWSLSGSSLSWKEKSSNASSLPHVLY